MLCCMEDDNGKPKDGPSDSSEAKVMSFRAPLIVQKQLVDLKRKWGDNITHVIHRCIAIAHERECGKKR